MGSFMQKTTSFTPSDEESKKLNEMAGPGSKMAVGALLNRFFESQRPEGERICYDPYAVQFVNQEILEWESKNPERARARREQLERLIPGLKNSITARCRYFDDFIKSSVGEGIEQLVILGAGYDSRAFRIEGLKRIKIFELDHPATQDMKIEKIKKIFGALPDHVIYVPFDLIRDNLVQKLHEAGYDRSRKALFVMEGLLYYLPSLTVDSILSFIAENSGKGSSILFDYFPQSVVDGSIDLEVGRNIHDGLAQTDEPLKFGIDEGKLEDFLTKKGFSHVMNVTSNDYKKAYFHGINKDRTVCSLLLFAHAVIE
jgi:methyltransferase (TIGR00027 family)